MHDRYLAFRTARAMLPGGAGNYWPCSASSDSAIFDKRSDHAVENVDVAIDVPLLPQSSLSGQTENTALDSEITSVTTMAQKTLQTTHKMESIAIDPASNCTVDPASNCTVCSSIPNTGLSEDIRSACIATRLEGGDIALGRAVLRVYQRSTLMPGGYLDLEATYVEHAIRHSDSSSSFHTSKPIAAAVSKRKYQCVALLLAAYFGYLELLAIDTALRGGIHFSSSLLRFAAVALRNPNLPANLTTISSLGLLYDGCSVKSPLVAMRKLDNAYYAFYDSEVQANGFYFVTSSVSPDLDPIMWYAQTSVDNGSSWVAIASSVMMINRAGTLSFTVDLPYPTPGLRNNSIKIDLRITWQWIVCWIGANALTILQYLALGFAGMTGREGSAKLLWLIFNVWAAIFLGVAAIGYNSEGLSLDAAYHWINVIPSCFLSLGFMFFEEKFVLVIFMYGVIRTGASALQTLVLYKKPWTVFTRDFSISTSLIAFVFVILTLLNRKRIVLQAYRLVVKDMEQYNVTWKTVSSENGDALLRLKSQVQELMKTCPKSVPRQVVVKSMDSSSEATNNTGSFIISSTQYQVTCKLIPWGLTAPVQTMARKLDSIDQLFSQAECIHPLLLEKVNKWALLSGGCFPVLFERIPSITVYAEVKDDQDAQIKYGKLKSTARSIEKLARSYCMDVSRLLDVCRQTIVYHTVENITTCLASIAQDPEIKILRIKNRMDPEYHASRSAGYRDVGLNLQIVSAQTKALGVDSHVCELQLMLQAVAELKSEEGHKRYVTFRNLRAE